MTDDFPHAEWGSRIRALRKKAKLTQEELGEMVGVTRQQVSVWEKGREFPQGPNLMRLSAALGVEQGHFVVRGTGDIDYDPHPDPEGSPAEQLMAFLGQRVGMRRVAGSLTSKDLIAVAYTIAREERFGPDEFKKIDRWRDEIMAMERSTPD